MATKTYFCQQFPKLVIAGICQFENHKYTTASRAVQSRLEQSQSFRAGIVRLEETSEADLEQEQAEILGSVKPADLTKMKKTELAEMADIMEIEYGSDATRSDLLSLVAEAMRREE